MRKSNKILSVLGVLAIVFSFAMQTHAADLRFESICKKCQVFTINNTDNVKNLYATGPQVIMDANPTKDAVLAGGAVSANGNVKDDLFIAGGNIFILGNVGASARAVGATITVQSAIGEDLAALGGNISILPKASIGGDLAAAGGVISVQAPVHGNVIVKGGTLYINSEVDGNISFNGQSLQLGPGASIKGNINYTSATPYDRDPAAKVLGNVTYQQAPQKNFRQELAVFIGLAFLIKLIATILAGLLLAWLFRKKFETMAAEIQSGFWKNVGWGALFFILTPLISFVLGLTVIGIYIAVILMAVWFVALLFAWLVGATAFGWWILKYLNAKKQPAFGYGVVTLALLISTVLAGIPILGVLFTLVLGLAGMGVVFKNLRASR